ncbi:SnoaL-like polyketide cyclase [Colletotrichum lupini]|uniref:SnoaL-like polyketide cyclase n=1 Tax=Colletotrichum lupini TaxID=145971 RepID=A0A9Q8SJZ8_9PEZI|nr:SnoaL-like polyketide cyclase [Colletotrichum lupini]UQC77882.1 SnoaL-like polyketide cyclase [Colletotrichum lupini]
MDGIYRDPPPSPPIQTTPIVLIREHYNEALCPAYEQFLAQLRWRPNKSGPSVLADGPTYTSTTPVQYHTRPSHSSLEKEENRRFKTDNPPIDYKMASQDIVSIFQAFLNAVNNKKWDEVHNHLQPVVRATYNENTESRDQFINRLTTTADKGSIFSADQRCPRGDLILVFFENGKIVRLYQVANQQSRGVGPVPAPPFVPEYAAKGSQNPISAAKIEALYRKYIYSYNDGTMPTVLPALWAETISMHGNLVPAVGAVGFLGKILLPVIAGLKYEVDEFVVDEKKQQIAVRLSISGVPQNKNLQKNGPDGKVTVYEHALYGYEEGKVAWAWAAQAFDMRPPSVLSDPKHFTFDAILGHLRDHLLSPILLKTHSFHLWILHLVEMNHIPQRSSSVTKIASARRE